MQNNEKLGVFISWSGVHAREISQAIYDELIRNFRNETDPYICVENVAGEKGTDQVINALKKSDLFIFVLTEGSVGSEWVLYEFAYASALRDYKGGAVKIHPVLFDSGLRAELPKPVREQGIQVVDFNRKAVQNIIQDICDAKEVRFTNRDFERVLDGFCDAICAADERGKKAEKAAAANVKSQSDINTVINPELILFQEVKSQSTGDQASLAAPDVAQGKTLGEIPDMFASYLETLPERDKILKPVAITGDLLAALPHQDVSSQHELWFKGTRISTFVAIRDEKRILLWDRFKAGSLQEVDNKRIDCFGGVAFENYSIFNKLRGSAFKTAVIQSLSKIPSLAFEDIATKDYTGKKGSYLCMMFGYEAVISAADFDAIMDQNKGNVALMSVEMERFMHYAYNGLTSKAQAYYDYLVNTQRTAAYGTRK